MYSFSMKEGNELLDTQHDAAATLCQVLKEALADGEQGPVVALQDGGGGHHELGLRVHLW